MRAELWLRIFVADVLPLFALLDWSPCQKLALGIREAGQIMEKPRPFLYSLLANHLRRAPGRIENCLQQRKVDKLADHPAPFSEGAKHMLRKKVEPCQGEWNS